MKIGIFPSTHTRGITAAIRYIMHRCVLGVLTFKPIGEPGAITFKSRLLNVRFFTHDIETSRAFLPSARPRGQG